MQPGDGLSVNPTELEAHAESVSQIATDVAAAMKAAEYARVHREAYGKICAFVPDQLNNMSAPLVDGLRSVVTSLNDTALRLRIVAAGYGAADGRAADRQLKTE